jgi:hypothetical protein
MARTGKIARLPNEVREQLNHRLRDGESGRRLVEWLNSLPEVKTVLAAEFGGEPIQECNLSQYRKGGYQEWFCRQEALTEVRNLATEATGIQEVAPGALSDRLATWLAARYAVAAAKMDRSGADDKEKWTLLRELGRDIVALRRGDQYARHLENEAKWLGIESEQTPEEMAKQLRELAQKPEVHDLLLPDTMTKEEKKEKLRTIFGFKEDYTHLTDEEKIDAARMALFGEVVD